jgi:hypothetical protein
VGQGEEEIVEKSRQWNRGASGTEETLGQSRQLEETLGQKRKRDRGQED